LFANQSALKAAREKQHDDNDQDDAEDADSTVTIAVPIASEATAETAQQEDDDNDCKDEAERHYAVLSRKKRKRLRSIKAGSTDFRNKTIQFELFRFLPARAAELLQQLEEVKRAANWMG